MKILLIDIETAPNLATVWGLFKQNIPITALLNTSYVLCWSAKWLGESEVFFDSVQQSSKKRMLMRVHKLLSQADAVIHYNGSRFDIPTLNKEFLLLGMPPPTPFKQIDLLKTVRSKFRFTSNKLDFVSKQLGGKGKVKHEGHELWLKCMNKDKEAWAKMREYNIDDVIIMEDVYNKLLPWITNHPNWSVHQEKAVCPNCGSLYLQRRGFHVSQAGKYQRFRCNKCGTWSRGSKITTFKDRLQGLK